MEREREDTKKHWLVNIRINFRDVETAKRGREIECFSCADVKFMLMILQQRRSKSARFGWLTGQIRKKNYQIREMRIYHNQNECIFTQQTHTHTQVGVHLQFCIEIEWRYIIYIRSDCCNNARTGTTLDDLQLYKYTHAHTHTFANNKYPRITTD